MLISSIAGLVSAYVMIPLVWEKTTPTPDVEAWFFGASIFVRDATFNVAHWMIGWQYSKIAQDVPESIQEDEQPVKEPSVRKWIYWTVMALSVLVPLGEGLL